VASYLELRNLFSNGDLLNKIDFAIVKAANDLINGTPGTKEKSWATDVFSNPRAESQKALKVLLAGNSGMTISQIISVTDTAIQTAVDGVVPVLIDAKAGV